MIMAPSVAEPVFSLSQTKSTTDGAYRFRKESGMAFAFGMTRCAFHNFKDMEYLAQQQPC